MESAIHPSSAAADYGGRVADEIWIYLNADYADCADKES